MSDPSIQIARDDFLRPESSRPQVESFQAVENHRVRSGYSDQTRVRFFVYHIPHLPWIKRVFISRNTTKMMNKRQFISFFYQKSHPTSRRNFLVDATSWRSRLRQTLRWVNSDHANNAYDVTRKTCATQRCCITREFTRNILVRYRYFYWTVVSLTWVMRYFFRKSFSKYALQSYQVLWGVCYLIKEGLWCTVHDFASVWMIFSG